MKFIIFFCIVLLNNPLAQRQNNDNMLAILNSGQWFCYSMSDGTRQLTHHKPDEGKRYQSYVFKKNGNYRWETYPGSFPAQTKGKGKWELSENKILKLSWSYTDAKGKYVDVIHRYEIIEIEQEEILLKFLPKGTQPE